MALHPPSFFEAPQQHSSEGEVGRTVEGDVKIEHGIAGKAGPINVRDEVAALRQENQDLKKCLRSLSHPPPALEATSSPCVHHSNPSTRPAVLANDLLQVEAHLQSRMRSLEEEKRELALQLLELERTLYRTKEHYERQVESMRSENEKTLLQTQLESEQLQSEYQVLQKEKAARIQELESELTALQERSVSEVETMQARVADLEQRNQAMRSELDEERVAHGQELAEVRAQLAEREGESEQARRETETQLSSFQRDLSAQRRRVQQLEAYLGGELPSEGTGLTWREERSTLTTRIRDLESEGQRLQSETKLLNIRLASLSEILTIQETDIAKRRGKSEGGSGEGGFELVKSLLSRWREKVFALLVQQKLQQIQDSREKMEARVKEQGLLEQQQQLEVEKNILSHTLADKTAELQLQTGKTEELQHCLDEAGCTIRELERQLHYQQEGVQHVGSCLQRMADVYGHCKASFDQGLTRLANYEQRLTFASQTLNSVKASLTCHFAILGSQVDHSYTVDTSCQTEPEDTPEGLDLTSFSREQLIHKMATLTRERDSLAKQLSGSTAAFEEKLQGVKEACTLRLSVLEERMGQLQREKETVSEQLSGMVGRQSAVEEERDCLQERVGQLERQLRDTQATVEARLEAVVLEQQQRSREELCEMEGLLNVAKREHTKAVVQLQQLQRQVEREKERAIQAAVMSKAQTPHQRVGCNMYKKKHDREAYEEPGNKVERELESCKRKLQTVQAERNLLLTTLRQEGIVAPSKRPPPRRPALVTAQDSKHDSENEDKAAHLLETTSVVSLLSDEECTVPHVARRDAESGSDEDSKVPITAHVCPRKETVTHQGLLQGEASSNTSPAVLHGIGDHMAAAGAVEAGHQDIREVLKDLQMLSASLLGLETRNVTETG